MTARLSKPLAALAAASALLAGCVSFGPEVPEQLIGLTPEMTATAGEMARADAGPSFVVLDPDVGQKLDVLRVPVQIDPSSIAYVQDATWVERPARQFRSLLAETIRAKTGRLVIEGDDLEVTGDLFVSGRLLDMGYDVGSQSVVVRYDAVLEGRDGAVRSRRFESRVPGVSATAVSVAPALNRAANDVAQQVADWLVS
ncbi:hypothetical protein GCM10011371_23260 [Novosphingobium marinum]|uniref:Cholesterol transport system auxiliary component n=1 Tax=Novosphingobium marinum TaxID=1514948 RepID=A0A7Z0BTW1_9SPHN|nr:ABC-type transport auxiliary lipoprotein family protein [Novosphingobium marinum]NYH96441.1 cholesterol transport system auxiliary component [Novosphingobium marinum]GGC35248.1 hypothetical protein GCM10011371_23260 [Novosphingobium marinum]